ncbi:MAG: hypothetical protein HY302_03870 [Opitutae bacterium]|nr:hypothetical protein [Opitutae bacterium]
MDALLVAFIFVFGAAILSPVVLQYSPWRWYVCAAFISLAVVTAVVRRRVAAREEKKTYRELRPRTKFARRSVACAYGLFGLIAIAGVIAFANIANDAFRNHRPKLGVQMLVLAISSGGVIASVARGIRLQLEEETK